MAIINRSRIIKPSTRLDKSKSYSVNTDDVGIEDILIVHISHEFGSFNASFRFNGESVSERKEISFSMIDTGNGKSICWNGAFPEEMVPNAPLKKNMSDKFSIPLIPVDDTRNREGWVEGLSPIEDEDSRILILGTMPGVESLIQQAYYANPRNVFWKMLSEVTGMPIPDTYEDKKEFLLRNKIALWDICRSCIRNGSLDSNISYEMPNDINRFVEEHPHLKVIGFNGKTSERLFRKHIVGISHVELVSLPSTSPANASVSLEKKVEVWKKLKDHM